VGVLDDEVVWCRDQLARSKRERGEADWSCNCWVLCTAACEAAKSQWKLQRDIPTTLADARKR
jgi:hypothetical protein